MEFFLFRNLNYQLENFVIEIYITGRAKILKAENLINIFMLNNLPY